MGHLQPAQNVAAIAQAWGIYNSAPASGGGGGGGGGGPRLQEGRVRVADGRQDRRGLDEGRDAPPPLEQREGHPEPAIDAKGGLRERERPAG